MGTAHYVDGTVDNDFDGFPDWYEFALYGNLNRNGASDTDSDGLSFSTEYSRGYSPLVRDSLAQGGVSRRRSVLTAVNAIVLNVPPFVTVNGATDVTLTSARLNALVNPVGLATTVYTPFTKQNL